MESELRKKLSGVRAPADLWDRVELAALSAVVLPRRGERVRHAGSWILAMATALIVTTLFAAPAKVNHGQGMACRVGDPDVKLTLAKSTGGVVAASGHQAFPVMHAAGCVLCHAAGSHPIG